jgi:hypothetical protein
MRTKTLYLTALLGAVSIATSVAQTVYSVNAVGYVNVTLVPGYNLIANPLVAETNTVAVLFDAAPNGTVVYKFNATTAAYVSTTKNKITGKWNDTALSLLPGEGAFVKNVATTNVVITFVGEVMQGTLTNSLPVGYSIASSQVPQADTLDNLSFPKVKGDAVYKFVSGAYQTFSVNKITGNWSPSVPSAAVAESFFVKKAVASDWTRTFSVNQ